jgi:hypothetical protein
MLKKILLKKNILFVLFVSFLSWTTSAAEKSKDSFYKFTSNAYFSPYPKQNFSYLEQPTKTLVSFKSEAAEALSAALLSEWKNFPQSNKLSFTRKQYKNSGVFFCTQVTKLTQSNECFFIINELGNVNTLSDEDVRNLITYLKIPQFNFNLADPSSLPPSEESAKITFKTSTTPILGSLFFQITLSGNSEKLTKLYDNPLLVESNSEGINLPNTLLANHFIKNFKLSNHLKYTKTSIFNNTLTKLILQTNQEGQIFSPDFDVSKEHNLVLNPKAFLKDQDNGKSTNYTMAGFVDYAKKLSKNNSTLKLLRNFETPTDPNKIIGDNYFFKFNNTKWLHSDPDTIKIIELRMKTSHCELAFMTNSNYHDGEYYQPVFTNLKRLSNSNWGDVLFLNVMFIQVEKNPTDETFTKSQEQKQFFYSCYIEESAFNDPNYQYDESMFWIYLTPLFEFVGQN